MVSLKNRLPWGNIMFRIFRIRGKFRTCQTSTIQHFAKIVSGYNYFCIIELFSQYQLSRSLPYEINMNLVHIVLIFNLEVSIHVKKYMARGGRGS